MRKLNEWIENIDLSLKHKVNEFDFKESEFFQIELALTLFYDLFPEKSALDFWTLMTGYHFQIEKYEQLTQKQKLKLARAKFYLIDFRSKSKWEQTLKNYFKLPEEIRLFNFNSTEDNEYLLKIRQPALAANRYEYYEDTLLKIPEHRKKEIDWLNTNSVFLKKGKKKYKIQVPDQFFRINPEKMREKYKIQFNRNKDKKNPSWNELLETAKWIDSKMGIGGDSWRYERLQKIELKLKKEQIFKSVEKQDEVIISDFFNVVGMLGFGKSLLIDVLLVWAARNKMHSTLILESVSSIINKTEFLNKLGIKAAPIIGKSNLEKHRNNYLMLNYDDDFNFDNLGSLDLLESTCALQGLIKENELLDRSPCNHVYLDEDLTVRKYCPYYYQCTAQKRNLNLMEADIWLGTQYSFIYTRLPIQLAESSIFFSEVIYRKSDLLLFDEVDLTQSIFDQIFTPDQLLINKKSSSWFNRLDTEVSKYRTDKIGNFEDSLPVSNWLDNFDHTRTLVNRIYKLISKNKEIEKWLDNDFITSGRLSSKITEELKGKAKNKLFKIMDEFTNNISGRGGRLLSLSNNLIAFNYIYEDEYPVGHLFETFFKKYSIPNNKLNFDKFKLLLLIKALEKSLHHITVNWKYAKEKMNLSSEGISLFHNNLNYYFPLLPESPLANIYGFRYINTDGNEPHFYSYSFKGLGRKFLFDFNNILKKSDKLEGPRLITFSGTSWLPESSYFHLEKEVDAVIVRPKTEMQKLNKSKFKFINTKVSISGSSGQERIEKIKEMLNKLIEKNLKAADNYSRLQNIKESIEDQDRKNILIVVGSYKEAKIVESYLNENLDAEYWGKNSAVAMIRDSEEKESGRQINRSLITKFIDHQGSILIAPLRAINRGYNILNKNKQSAIGAALFLIRPMPVPSDFINQIAHINSWAVKKIKNNDFKNEADSMAENFNKELRYLAMKKWKQMTERYLDYGGIAALNDSLLIELYANQLVLIWQTIGRLHRGNSRALIYFCDLKFAPKSTNNLSDDFRSSMLIAFYKILEKHFNSDDEYQRIISENLYSPFYYALKDLKEELV
ncbi:MAG: hypothetical protein ACOCRX_05810 [Candidatus Woesearchaeota archaeon]